MHYESDAVRKEIFEFSKGRWIALQGRTFVRYDAKGDPLYFKSDEDVPRYVNIYGARTIYATAAIYSDLKNFKISKFTPFFDIDTKIDKWEFAIQAAKVILEALNEHDLKESIYLLWSGEGIHLRINENSLPKNIDPFICSKAIVNYILKITKNRILELISKSNGSLKVENLIDEKRLFTVPLSFHRTLNLVTVCFPPDDIDNFNIEWANPNNYKHKAVWNKYKENEAEYLCKIALKEAEVKIPSLSQGVQTNTRSKIGRFQVMGILQAARYYVLYNELDKAKSFGMNRAIFYAWAKHYGRFYSGKSQKSTFKSSTSTQILTSEKTKEVAGEIVYQDEETGYFKIGDRVNLPKDFDREIKSKIEIYFPFEKVWNAAVKYVSSFPKEYLLDQRKFYERIYLPVRDNFESVMKN